MSATIKALSIRQPWAWLIANGHKDIENRDWRTSYRGQFLIHAGKLDDESFDWSLFRRKHIQAPRTFQHGGIIGIATLTDVVTYSESEWFQGVYGFVLKDARPVPFTPLRGQLYFFDVPEYILRLLNLPLSEARAESEYQQ